MMMKKRKPTRKARIQKGRSKKHSDKIHSTQSHTSSRISLKATVDKNKKGFAFLIPEGNQYPDIYLPPEEALHLFHGDRVELTLGPQTQRRQQSRLGKKNPDPVILNLIVLDHRYHEIVGRFIAQHQIRDTPQVRGWVIFEKKRMRQEIPILQLPGVLRSGDWVRVALTYHAPKTTPRAHKLQAYLPVTGKVLEVYGQSIPASADIQVMASEFNLNEQHSKQALAEASLLPEHVSESEFGDRTDLRQIPFITIDGENARDFDDAIYIEKAESGYVLWVAISDVSHYVHEGSSIDRDARERGTSVYFPERAFHMLPRALSENLCSLKPLVPRLAQVARIEFDHSGKKLGTQLILAVIQSQRRATYNQIQAEWESHLTDSKWPYAPHFALYQLLRKQRIVRGSLDFELPEAEITVDAQGEVTEIRNRPRLESHRLMERKWPFIYRVHLEPSVESLRKFQVLATSVGLKISIDQAKTPKAMSELIRKLEGHPAQTLLNISLLRSLKQAIYTPKHGIHYGLASAAYTHFTSPIRRYPDLVVHRLIRMALKAEALGNATVGSQQKSKLEQELVSITEHCSQRERLAAEAEREAIKVKQVRVMQNYLGRELDGRIVGMVNAGMFVQLTNPYVEGLVNATSIAGDIYEFNEEKLAFLGLRTKRIFKIGDLLKVQVLRADLESRQIDFGIVEGGPIRKK
jgi:ribonuclease R